jgi:hypothetical protein
MRTSPPKEFSDDPSDNPADNVREPLAAFAETPVAMLMLPLFLSALMVSLDEIITEPLGPSVETSDDRAIAPEPPSLLAPLIMAITPPVETSASPAWT